MAQEAFSIHHDIIRPVTLNYLRYLPPDYGQDPDKKWPLILFLHGAGERGDDLNLIKPHGIPRIVEERAAAGDPLPFVTLSPQCPMDHRWSDYLPVLEQLLTEALNNLNIDPLQVYLTGLSMGGFGAWHLAVEYPQYFAALAPVCGGGSRVYGFPERVCTIRDIPAWVFHGAKDDIVPIQESEIMVDTLKACGGDVRFTVYPNAGHDSWTETYSNPELYAWFLAHPKAG